MARIAFMFPGQGSQEVGMGRDMADDPHLLRLLSVGSDLVGRDLLDLCIRGPDTVLRKATFLQPALAALSLALYRRLSDAGIRPDLILGHSLGEIIALGASGVVSEEEAITIATKRGELMDQVASRHRGGMLAVVFTPTHTVRSLISGPQFQGRIVLANDNGPEQTVLSGDLDALEEIAKTVARQNLGKTQILPVVGPWHSPYMEEAREAFEPWVAPRPFTAPQIPMVFNATAQRETDPQRIKRLITGQLSKPVFWRQCMETLSEEGIDTLIEVGPGRVLSGLARVNGFTQGGKTYSAANLRGIETIVAEIGTSS